MITLFIAFFGIYIAELLFFRFILKRVLTTYMKKFNETKHIIKNIDVSDYMISSGHIYE